MLKRTIQKLHLVSKYQYFYSEQSPKLEQKRL